MSMGNGEPNKGDMESGVEPEVKGAKQATKKIIRVLTVMAYLSSVSMAAIMLSLYYIFLWNPPSPAHNAQIMPSELVHFDTGTETFVPDRLMNRTWEAPEEPRALPVKIYEPAQMTEDVAMFHSRDGGGDWEDRETYNMLRTRRRRRSPKQVKILQKTYT